jgi:hypothetical protein
VIVILKTMVAGAVIKNLGELFSMEEAKNRETES